MIFLIGLGVGTAVGWSLHTAYLRTLWKEQKRIKRAMRGAQGRRQR
jgi:hypothetical protein